MLCSQPLVRRPALKTSQRGAGAVPASHRHACMHACRTRKRNQQRPTAVRQRHKATRDVMVGGTRTCRAMHTACMHAGPCCINQGPRAPSWIPWMHGRFALRAPLKYYIRHRHRQRQVGKPEAVTLTEQSSLTMSAMIALSGIATGCLGNHFHTHKCGSREHLEGKGKLRCSARLAAVCQRGGHHACMHGRC